MSTSVVEGPCGPTAG